MEPPKETLMYGVKYPEHGVVVTSASKEQAQSAVDCAHRFPATKGAQLMKRKVIYTDWEPVTTKGE